LKNVVPGALPTIPLPSEKFDIVLCLDVLEHIPDDQLGLQEVYRLLAPGSIAIIFVPTFSFLWGKSDELGHHYRRYRLPVLEQRAKNVGFMTLQSSYFNFILFLPILIARFLVRVLKLRIQSENTTRDGIFNTLLRSIFFIESQLLKHINLPFGVSGLLVLRKPL
jgi:SAM-dependent methyltransferase